MEEQVSAELLTRMIRAGAGKVPADLVIRNVRRLDVITIDRERDRPTNPGIVVIDRERQQVGAVDVVHDTRPRPRVGQVCSTVRILIPPHHRERVQNMIDNGQIRGRSDSRHSVNPLTRADT